MNGERCATNLRRPISAAIHAENTSSLSRGAVVPSDVHECRQPQRSVSLKIRSYRPRRRDSPSLARYIMSSSLYGEIVASVASGCAATSLGHPLDCIKVRMQALQRPGLGPTECAIEMLKGEGLQAFTRGIGPPLAEKLFMNTFMFLAFAESRKVLPDNTLGSLLSGAIAGLVTSLVSTPCDWVKIQQQTRGGSVANLAIVGEALRAGGPSRLFTGHFMNMGREGVYTAFYLGLFDAIKKVILGDDRLQRGERLPIHLVAAASASTGAIAWVASYPFDVIKSVQQAQPAHAPGRRSTIRGAAESIWRSGGLRAFYRGVSASTLRAILVASSRLVAYEQVKAWGGWS